MERRDDIHRFEREKDADLWIAMWEELNELRSEAILIEVEHVKAHRTEKERRQMSLFEKFVTEGNEQAYEPPKEAATWDAGLVAQARASTIQQERRSVRSFAVCSQFSLLGGRMKDCEELKPKPKVERSGALMPQLEEKWIFEDKKRDDTNHRTEWCATANKYRCMRCGRGSKFLKMQGKCAGPKWLIKKRKHKIRRW